MLYLALCHQLCHRHRYLVDGSAWRAEAEDAVERSRAEDLRVGVSKPRVGAIGQRGEGEMEGSFSVRIFECLGITSAASCVTSPKVKLKMVSPARLVASALRNPLQEPVPYWSAKD